MSKKTVTNGLGEFIYLRSYARWIESKQRREVWPETVERYMAFMQEQLGDKLSLTMTTKIKKAILNKQIMPSMRLLQFAGKAARCTQVCGYNCAYIAPNCLDDLAEIMYISMCGTGVGFSVERANVMALPMILKQVRHPKINSVIKDSREGWCDALKLGLKNWYQGKDVVFDYHLLRPEGTRLKTLGGRSSGPEPLKKLLNYTRELILANQGRRLSCLQLHDLICQIGEVVVAGGVRRSAMISLSDLSDNDLRDAKKGKFYRQHPYRSLANNSAVYQQKPNEKVFQQEWLALKASGSGERGLFNRSGFENTLPERRLALLRDKITRLGTNPCGEIILQSKQFCNLTEVIARPDDTEKSLLEKIKLATIVGTFQATLTNFKYLSKQWQKNCEQERLLGVSITGQWDCAVVRRVSVLKKLKQQAIATNQRYAKKFAINPATAITCVKPSGSVSQLVDCSSGMHPRYGKYYIRRVRVAASDPLLQLLKVQGIPCYQEVGQSKQNCHTYVVEFPVAAPKNAVTNLQLSAIKQLNYWKRVKAHFTEHNPSVTIFVEEHEWQQVADWVLKNWSIIGGLSFLPKQDHVYELAPYELISRQRYMTLRELYKDIDFKRLGDFEKSDQTILRHSIACGGGSCELY